MTDVVNVERTDPTPSAYVYRMAEPFQPVHTMQVVVDLRRVAQHGRVVFFLLAHLKSQWADTLGYYAKP